MHAVKVLRSCLGPVFACMHARRCAVLLDAVRALVVGRHLTLMELARSWPDSLRVAAPLKKLDRLLGNPHLAGERESIYAAMTGWLVRQPRPVIVVDWSPLDARGRFQLLRAGLAVGGRTLTLYERVCPATQIGNPKIERGLLRALRRSMPVGSKPIMVTDAGFRAPWFRAVQTLGWDWIGRVRGRALVKPQHLPDTPDRWRHCEELYRRAGAAARDLGVWEVVRNHSVACRLVLHCKRPRGRADLTLKGQRVRSKHSRTIAKRESDPWLLAVSPTLDLTPAQVTGIYARRMQIEQSFRDLKSHRYGVGFEDSLTRTGRRLATLLLIHALVCFVAWIATKVVSRDAWRAAVATMVRSNRPGTLSWHRIGWCLLREDRWRSRSRITASAIIGDGDALASG